MPRLSTMTSKEYYPKKNNPLYLNGSNIIEQFYFSIGIKRLILLDYFVYYVLRLVLITRKLELYIFISHPILHRLNHQALSYRLWNPSCRPMVYCHCQEMLQPNRPKWLVLWLFAQLPHACSVSPPCSHSR